MKDTTSGPKFYRVHISFTVLFPKKSDTELGIRTELKMLEENLKDSQCSFEPAFDQEFSNILLTVIPVQVFINRSMRTTEVTTSGLALKAERMADCANYSLQAVTIDCLVPEGGVDRSSASFSTDFKQQCLEVVLKQLNEYMDNLIRHPDIPLVPIHFTTSTSRVLTALVPSEANYSQRLEMARKSFGLQNNEQLLGNIFSDIWATTAGNHLINPHTALATPEPIDLNAPTVAGKSATLEMSVVPGYYRYFRYTEDGFNDSGWGCAYRSLQTVCSWFRLQGYTDKVEPDHKTIQKILVEIGDKQKNFIGSTQWIGSTEVNYVLENYLGVKCRILNVSSGEELDSLASSLIQHFRTDGAPVMIGGGVYAHTIVGVFLNRSTGVVRYLVLDPHYSAPAKSSYADELKIVTTKGWVGWKEMTFWKKGEFYNLCLPMRPKLE